MLKLLIASLISFSTFAANLTFNGHYHFQNDTKIVFKKRYEIVNASNRAGKDRLIELQNAEYTCLYITNPVYECSKVTNEPSALDQRAQDLVYGELYGQSLFFAQSNQLPVLTNDSESIKEWTYNQKATFLGGEFPSFRLHELGSLKKLVLGNPTQYSFVVKNDVLLLTSIKRLHLTKNISELIVLESIFAQ